MANDTRGPTDQLGVVQRAHLSNTGNATRETGRTRRRSPGASRYDNDDVIAMGRDANARRDVTATYCLEKHARDFGDGVAAERWRRVARFVRDVIAYSSDVTEFEDEAFRDARCRMSDTLEHF